MRTFLALLATPAIVLAAQGTQAESVTLGSPAPAFKVSRWVKGTPVATLEKGKVYVVEFWATWCGPCRQTIPHLSEMAKKFEGKATFMGVNVWERGDSPQQIETGVDAFVKDMGEKMGYAVARDTADGHMANAWMKAANQDGIPAAFIINGEGQVAWIGHPMNGLEKTLEAVLAGKHDIAAAKAAAEKEAAKEAQRTALINEFGKGLSEANKAKDYAKLLNLTDQVLAKYPDQAELIFRFRFIALLHVDEARAKALLEAEKNSTEPDFVTPAVTITGEWGLAKEWYERAAGYLEAELKSPEANPALNVYLGRALHQAGRSKEAVVVQERLIAAAKGKVPESRMAFYEAELKVYREAAAKADTQTPTTPTKAALPAKKG